jgi:hypothetical protein
MHPQGRSGHSEYYGSATVEGPDCRRMRYSGAREREEGPGQLSRTAGADSTTAGAVGVHGQPIKEPNPIPVR